MNVRTKFEVRIFTRSLDNRGYFKILDSPYVYMPSLSFLQNFNRLLFGWTPYRPNLNAIALPAPEIIVIEVLGGGFEPPILGMMKP